MLTLSLPEALEKRLTRLATVTGRSKSFYVREAILKHLDDLEDVYLTGHTIERVRNGQEKVYSSEELKKRLAPDD